MPHPAVVRTFSFGIVFIIINSFGSPFFRGCSTLDNDIFASLRNNSIHINSNHHPSFVLLSIAGTLNNVVLS